MAFLLSAPHRLALIGVLALVLGAAGGRQESTDDVLEQVKAGLEQADPGAVLGRADARVEVVLFGRGGTVRRTQAVHVLRDFFRRYPPDRVAIAERSSSEDGLTAIWRYWTAEDGQPLNVRAVHREGEGGWRLVSLRVERRSALRGGR
ncbi:DUF4783 domain-containing protein [Rubrivirga sp. S365]|uniref:DUF4783 domain-containing protein n=1 Tax=Rubrivirga litoralis TaxID=3075598 RepID=A0ABU3BRV7_9BACT|nr:MULTISPECIES: DUF4783 domain-containing protein [unclassified Rubrivirga]MDT0632023.1 DUF4783 domain-containing protein [Rubrivirga sp. F394]MDT7855284.1 DUF4783 domain-containing protein [Rubrivirga sp. S365]